MATLPRSSRHANRVTNLDVFGFTLREEEMARIFARDRGMRLYAPPWAPDWDA